MKKTSVKIVLVLLIVLLLTVLSPEFSEKIPFYIVKKMDGILSVLETLIKQYLPHLSVTKETILAASFWILTTLLVLVGIRQLKKKRRYRKKAPASQSVSVKTKEKDERVDVIDDSPPEKDTKAGHPRDMLVRFFLNIYKIQIGALKTAPDKFKQVKSINVWPNRVYELSVLHDGDWVSRRLTIGPLGDDGVSKSVCYYVIYDDHLVVKIPADPINDFDEYIACIMADLRIARGLKPKECIIPRVSVILSRLKAQGGNTKTEILPESTYVERLTTHSQFQEYLKIGNSFVFFMDLARYYFLSRVITEMHDMDNAMPKEILGHPHIIWDTYEFEGRYGRDLAHIGFEMRNIYEEYEREINRLLIQYGVADPLPAYTMKSWFLVHLSGRGRIESEGDLSKAFIEDLNTLSRESMIDNRVSIESYRKIIREYIYTYTITRYKAEMISLITSLIALLIWLGRKRVAMRDLKPDNLLIAGDPEKYPQFLRSPDRFSLGFIDVETAVDYGKKDENDILQPQLGGTPKYATPSHLLPNTLIQSMYGQLGRILHLQDWYACVAMIFKVITGGTLFEKTAVLLPEIKRMMEASMDDQEHLESLGEYVSRTFWKSAVDEFYDKIETNKKILNAVNVIIIDSDKRRILSELGKAQKGLSTLIIVKMNEQTMFKGKKNKENLVFSSSEKIKEMRIKCESDTQGQLGNKADIVRFLKKLENLKKLYESCCGYIDFFKSQRTEIPVATIMEVMFNVVLNAMYTEVWGDFVEGNDDPGQNENPDSSYEATI